MNDEYNGGVYNTNPADGDGSRQQSQNQNYNQNQSQSYAPGQQYNPGSVYGSGVNQNQNQPYNQDYGYNRNQGYNQEQSYNQNQSYSQEQSYNQNQNYNQNQTQNQGYNPNADYRSAQQTDSQSVYSSYRSAGDDDRSYGEFNVEMRDTKPLDAPQNSWQYPSPSADVTQPQAQIAANRYAPEQEQIPAANYKKDKKGSRIFISLIVVIVVIALGVMAAILFGGNTLDKLSSSAAGETTSASSGESGVASLQATASTAQAGEAAQVAQVAQQYNVGILIYSNDKLYTEGSGVITQQDSTGTYTYIITCAHVVNYNNVLISVLMADGTEYPAELVGIDTRTDIAVIRIEASSLTCAEFADSDELIVGQTVYAVGNPGGSEFFGSVTNGIISAVDRPISSQTGYETDCIQHTAAINPGNSGGALVNGEGKVIGINSSKIASTEYEGMGFSVPSNVVIEVFNSIIENGYVAGRPKLGISYQEPSSYSQTYSMYIQIKGLPTGSIVIADISEDSDLYGKAQEGDIITAVNGEDLTKSSMLSEKIEGMAVGDTITLTIVRINTRSLTHSEFDVTVTLVEDKANTANDIEDNSGSGSYDEWSEFFKEFYGY